MATNFAAIKSRFVLLFAAGIFLASLQLSFGVEYTYQKIKIITPRVSLILGEKMVASGNVTVTSPEMSLKAATVTWLLDPSGNISKMEANGNVTFHVTNTSPSGALLTADGEGDNLIYLPLENKAIITVAAGKKAHINSIEQLPLPADAIPGQARPTRKTDIKASTITLRLKARSFDADGGVEMEVALPEKTAPAPEAPKPAETNKP